VIRSGLVVSLLAMTLATPASAATIVLDRSGSPPMLILAGEIVRGDGERFAEAAAGLDAAVVMLASPGGNMLAGLRIGQVVRGQKFSTLVPDGALCASACAYIWLGGLQRFMQPRGLVGFHAAYVVRDGAKLESGAGNALVGAYLSRLGLSDDAILYISATAPEQITWLTREAAERVGIQVTSLPSSTAPDEVSKQPASPVPGKGASPILSDNPADRARALAERYFLAWSGSNDSALRAFAGFYAPRVEFYGAATERATLLKQKTDFTIRWPERVYAVRGASLQVACAGTDTRCRVSGIVDWDTRSAPRRQRSVGSANFEFWVETAAGNPRIVSETGSVLSRAFSVE